MTPALIGANVRYWRERRGVPHKKLGIAGRTYYRLQRGEYNLADARLTAALLKIAERLDVAVGDLLAPFYAIDPFLSEVTHNLPLLSPHNRRILLEVLQDLATRKAA